MNEGAVNSSTPADAPHWSAGGRDICCPLCDYNLRGLVEPRCPECGHRFEWAEMLDPDRQHSWLFEHARRRFGRAILITLRRSMQATQFWNSVKPTHPPRLTRILVYWMLVNAVVVALVGGVMGYPIVRQYYDIFRERQEWAARPNATTLPHWKVRNSSYPWVFGRTPPAPMYPSLHQAFIWADQGVYGYSGSKTTLFFVAAGYLLWPWLTVAALQIFRRSMKMVLVNTPHVVRCAVYSADAGLLLILPVIAVVHWRVSSQNRFDHPLAVYGQIFEPVLLVVLIASVLTLTVRLCIAYRNYLKFPHAIATCAAAELIVVLTLLILYAMLAPI